MELTRNDIGERVRELRQTKANLPAEIYERRKHGISRQLKKLLPAGTNNELSIVKDTNGQLFTDNVNIARILTEHWQATFDTKATNVELRSKWLERIRYRLQVQLKDLRPTDDDIEKVLKGLHDSAAGPDGISTGIYMHLKTLAPSIF